MRVAVCWAVVGAQLGLASVAGADVFRYRDPSGALVFTNAPVGRAVRVIKDRPLPPAQPMLAARGRLDEIMTAPLPVGAPSAYDPLIRQIAERHGVEYALVKAIIKAESDFNYLAISSKGALGLMQLMPATAQQHQVQNVFLPRDNIQGGCRHLRMLLDRYGGNLSLAIAAYNAGTRRVEEAGGVPAISETREYLARVLRYRLAYLREGTGVRQASR
jgi:soluble lytic murein transglycosylase-like protein